MSALQRKWMKISPRRQSWRFIKILSSYYFFLFLILLLSFEYRKKHDWGFFVKPVEELYDGRPLGSLRKCTFAIVWFRNCLYLWDVKWRTPPSLTRVPNTGAGALLKQYAAKLVLHLTTLTLDEPFKKTRDTHYPECNSLMPQAQDDITRGSLVV